MSVLGLFVFGSILYYIVDRYLSHKKDMAVLEAQKQGQLPPDPEEELKEELLDAWKETHKD